MVHYSILLGSAPEDFRQKKLEEMFNFLDSKRNKGDSIVTFANGISEIMLEMVLDNSIKQLRHCERSEAISESNGDCFVADASCNDVADSNAPCNDTDGRTNSILLYICTLRPVAESEKSIWLGGEEIRRNVIRHYQGLAAECGIDFQVIFDFDSEMVSEEELGYEKVEGL